MRLGMSMFHEPELRIEQQCTECGGSLSDIDIGSTEEAIAISQCVTLRTPQDTRSKKCPKCGRVKTSTR